MLCRTSNDLWLDNGINKSDANGPTTYILQNKDRFTLK